MIENFPLLRQPPGSNSCLPTCVRAVLLWHGEQVTQEEVSEWCLEDWQGSVLDLALDGLREAGFDVLELIAPTEKEAEELLRNHFAEEDAPPVIVTLENPALSVTSDHAVVLTDIQRATTEPEVIRYMDSLTGDMKRDETGTFWQYWFLAQQRAFILRP